MKTRGFTLVELLVVIGIMGLLGTISVGAYRAINRGMEERSAVQVASQFIHAVYERALIERRPTAIYFYNETLRGNDTEREVVVGQAIAVRMTGRISRVQGDTLYDEFSDLSNSYDTMAEGAESNKKERGMRLYRLSQNELKYSRISELVKKSGDAEYSLLNVSEQGLGAADDHFIPEQYGFVCLDGSAGEWKGGDQYGMEFQRLTLPKGYIFGSSFSTSVTDPIKGESTMVFSSDGGAGGSTIGIYALRQGSGGDLTASKVGTTENPTASQSN